MPRMAPGQGALDVWIRGGLVVDGSGALPRRADIGIRGGRIVVVRDSGVRGAPLRARRTIDAAGLVVAPGFIDPHTHTYNDLLSPDAAARFNAAYLAQGVTTVVTGNDGGGPIDINGSLTRMQTLGIGTNVALYVGFGTIRARVLGASSAPATAAQRVEMQALVRRGMNGGALGLSTGLYYAPQSYASTEEVIALAREAATRGGVYDSHLRDESSYSIGVVGAVAEAIRIGKEVGMPVHIAHIKALGTEVWGKSDSIIALVDAARMSGHEVTADQYPYTASGTSLGAALLPRWAEAGGRDSLRWRAQDPETRSRLIDEMRRNLRRRNGAAAVLVTGGGGTLRGKTLDQIATARGQEPVAAALDIITTVGDVGIASFNMAESDIVRFMQQPWVFTGSDGSDGHPRKYGTYAKKLREYVLEKRVLSLEAFVRRSSHDVARALHIAERGTIAPFMWADVIVFDPAKVRDVATYEAATERALGMEYVLVNGRVVIDGGKARGVLAGRGIRRRQ